MIINKNWIFLLGFCLLQVEYSHAQKTDETEELKLILPLLEQKFDITFSYLNESIEGILVQVWQDPYELKAYLKYIEQQTDLKFTRLNQRYYTIGTGAVPSINVCGYLKDQETEEPLGQVAIASGKLNAVSNDDGYFEINGLQLGEQLIFKHIGYETTYLPMNIFQTDSCRIILLKEHLSALDEVIIYNYIAQGIEKKLNGAYAISNKQLQVLPGVFDQDVMQSLQVIPGVYSANESVSDINIRGGTGDQNLTLWDGIRMYQTGHFFGLISVFNPYFTREVELTKNGTTAGLGESVSSVIDIHGALDHSNTFSIEGGINLLNVDVEAEMPIGDKTSMYLGGRHSISGLLQSPTYEQYYDRAFGDILSANYTSVDTLAGAVQGFKYHDLGLKIIHTPNVSSNWALSVLNVKDELEFQEAAINSINAITKSSKVDQHSAGLNLSYQKKWSKKWSSLSEGYISYYQLKAENLDLINNQFLTQENEVIDWQAKFQASYKISDRMNWVNGYSFNERGITNQDQLNIPSFNRKIKEVIRTHSWFSEALYGTRENITMVSVGARLNYFESLNQQTIEPRILINHKLSNHWSLELAGELKSQTSLQVIDLQNDFLGIEKRRWVQSNNEDLPILKSNQLSAGLLFADKGWQLSLEGYLKNVNGIVTSSQSFQNQFELVRSTGEYRVSGLDVLASYQLEDISAWISYTISRNMNKFKDLLSAEFPGNVDIRHFLTSGISYTSNKIECSLGFNWHTGNPYTKPSEDQPLIDGEINYEFPNSSNLSSYLRVDMAAKYKFLIAQKIRTQIGISIWNVTNHYNQVNAYFKQNESDEISEVIENGLGFTPNLMIRMKL